MLLNSLNITINRVVLISCLSTAFAFNYSPITRACPCYLFYQYWN